MDPEKRRTKIVAVSGWQSSGAAGGRQPDRAEESFDLGDVIWRTNGTGEETFLPIFVYQLKTVPFPCADVRYQLGGRARAR